MFSFFVVAASLAACSNSDEPSPATYSMTAKKNGAGWRGEVFLYFYPETDSLAIFTRDKEFSLRMKVKFNRTGIYILKGNQAIGQSIVGEDITPPYLLSDNSEGRLVVTGYNDVEMSLEGTFEMVLKINHGTENAFSNVVDITEGHFKGTITEQ